MFTKLNTKHTTIKGVIMYRIILIMLCIIPNLSAMVFVDDPKESDPCVVYSAKLEISAISLSDEKEILKYSSGNTFYGTTCYTEGIIADPTYYPKGTTIYIKELQKWYTVDDANPEVMGKKDKIIIRFLSDVKKDKFKNYNYDVYVRIWKIITTKKEKQSLRL